MKKLFLLSALLLLLAGCGAQPAATTAAPETTVPVTEATAATTLPPLPPAPLELLLPEQQAYTTYDQQVLFSGTADPAEALLINGTPVAMATDGSFTCAVPLVPGENQITLSYLGQTQSFSVQRRYTTAWYAYEADTDICSGASVYAGIFAREGSEVRIRFCGETVKAEPSVNQLGNGVPEGFVLYTHRFETARGNEQPVDLGSIEYTVSCDGITEVSTSGNIRCGAAVEIKQSDPEATPDAPGYRDVGSGWILEVVDVNAETFNGATTDDASSPERNYLPKGTVDYGTQGVYYNEGANRYYHLLRCGVRVYRSNDNTPHGMAWVVDGYNGTLPDHNEIGIAEFAADDRFTYLTLDCLWKAPFFFRDEPQDYTQKDWHRYVLRNYDAGYVDITFCYATQFTGSLELPAEDPLFSQAELIQNGADCTLRLYLKQPGGLYGWSAQYNEAGQLCFRFLHPAQVQQADNPYGADLTGIKVMLDVGHGGEDPGANYSDGGKRWHESERNLALALLVKQKLESIGAEVVMNRDTEQRTVSRTERIAFLLEQAPDYCLCIHHNADLLPTTNGFDGWYFTPYSRTAAEHICQASAQSQVYRYTTMAWHYYFVARQTACPIVLAENGYMSNTGDLAKIADPAALDAKADALVQGIVNYYLAQSGYPVAYPKGLIRIAGITG